MHSSSLNDVDVNQDAVSFFNQSTNEYLLSAYYLQNTMLEIIGMQDARKICLRPSLREFTMWLVR